VPTCVAASSAAAARCSPFGAQDLARLVGHCKLVGAIARHIRPAGYDEEVVYLIALLQNLGRLVVQYHFPEEATQIERLMQPAPSAEPNKEDPGMSAEAASFAVLGVDIEAIGAAVARQMGFDEDVQQMIRRIPDDGSLRPGGNDAELLRATASCANEIGDALLMVSSTGKGVNRRQEALVRVVQRYARVLAIGMEEVIAAIQAARNPAAVPASRPADAQPVARTVSDEAAAKAA
jgi:eukaryotic-like serine/threonine-protein kinase